MTALKQNRSIFALVKRGTVYAFSTSPNKTVNVICPMTA